MDDPSLSLSPPPILPVPLSILGPSVEESEPQQGCVRILEEG